MTPIDLSMLPDVGLGPLEISHPFEVDLNCLVTANHRFTMEGIERAEESGLAQFRQDIEDQTTDPEVLRSMVFYFEQGFEDLRVAATNLAIVALVTRFHHWLCAYGRRLEPTRVGQQSLEKDLEFLNAHLGTSGPMPVQFFIDLAEVRHSVIHADSLPAWMDKGKAHRVAHRYTNGDCGVEVSEEQLTEAVDLTIKQIKWYDKKLEAIGK